MRMRILFNSTDADQTNKVCVENLARCVCFCNYLYEMKLFYLILREPILNGFNLIRANSIA